MGSTESTMAMGHNYQSEINGLNMANSSISSTSQSLQQDIVPCIKGGLIIGVTEGLASGSLAKGCEGAIKGCAIAVAQNKLYKISTSK